MIKFKTGIIQNTFQVWNIFTNRILLYITVVIQMYVLWRLDSEDIPVSINSWTI